MTSASAPGMPSQRRTAPLLCMRAEAGFPSPADDSIDRALDLHEHLVIFQAFYRLNGLQQRIKYGLSDVSVPY